MKESYVMANANVLFYNETLQTDAFTVKVQLMSPLGDPLPEELTFF